MGNSIGIRVFSSNNQIQGNLIGTDYTGTKAVGNSYGIYMDGGDTNNLIGGLDTNAAGAPLAGGGNVISGNGNGIDIFGSANVIEGNYLGTDITGTKAIGNSSWGVSLGNGATDNTVGGTTPAARNIISGNASGSGVSLHGNTGSLASNNVLEGNYIGLDVTGSFALGNGDGVWLYGAVNNTISDNVIAASHDRVGVGLENFGGPDLPITGNVVQGNFIGTDASGTHSTDPNGHTLGNPFGVEINNGVGESGTSDDLIGGTAPGQSNVIAGNSSDGVSVYNSTGNAILGNSIHDNGGLGINLVSGSNANNNQAAPVLVSAITRVRAQPSPALWPAIPAPASASSSSRIRHPIRPAMARDKPSLISRRSPRTPRGTSTPTCRRRCGRAPSCRPRAPMVPATPPNSRPTSPSRASSPWSVTVPSCWSATTRRR